METNVLRTESTFNTFDEARAAIEKYAAKTGTNLILGNTTKNSDGSGYRQAYFVCEKQGKYGGKGEQYITKRTGCPFVIGVNYRKRIKKFAITKSNLEHNHDIFLEATRFSTIARKFDQNDLGLIEKLNDDGLRTKDIFLVLNSISSKYIQKPDVYNAVSRQRQRKLQGLSEVEILLKTIQNDENIIGNIATKAAHNNEHDQDGEFLQAIFWAYKNTILEFALAKDVLIIDATYKTNRFLMPLIVICSVDQFGSTYPLAFALVCSETRDFYCWVMQQLSKVLMILTGDAQVATIITDRELALMSAISLVFPHAKHQLCIWHIFKNIRKKIKKDIDVDEFISTLQELIYDNLSIEQTDQKMAELLKQFPSAATYIYETWLPYKESWLGAYTNNNINLDIKSTQRVESLHSKLKGIENHIILIDKLLSVLWRQLQEHSQKLLYETFLHQNRNIQDKIDAGLKELRLICSRFAFESYIRQQGDFVESYKYEILALENNTYNRWYVQYIVETDHIKNPIPPLAVQIFKQLPECHHDTFSDLMQYALNYVLENGKIPKVPELLHNETNITQQTTFETINIENISDCERINIPEVKCKRGRPPNNKRIRGADEDKENAAHLKKTKAMQKLDKNDKILIHMFPKMRYYRFIIQLVMVTVDFGGSSQEYWFYSPECAQLASDTFNVPVIVFGMNTAASIFFLPFKQKPGLRKRPIILQWHGSNHIVLVKLKPNRSVQTLSLNPQYAPICSRLDLSRDWLALFV
ncbi:11637_t:CDS:2 [Gigaspora rosea]|nr:11637_t:CDS:2 [Gigaspora rosea]